MVTVQIGIHLGTIFVQKNIRTSCSGNSLQHTFFKLTDNTTHKHCLHVGLFLLCFVCGMNLLAIFAQKKATTAQRKITAVHFLKEKLFWMLPSWGSHNIPGQSNVYFIKTDLMECIFLWQKEKKLGTLIGHCILQVGCTKEILLQQIIWSLKRQVSPSHVKLG